jgi:tetratricopeptide (TPR) repeat protein
MLKSMRHTLAGLVLAVGSLTAVSAQAPPSKAEIYRGAVATYVRTGNPAVAVAPLLGWSRSDLEVAVADTIARADPAEMEAAAMLHLEIGVAIAGISTDSTAGYLDLGSRLIDGLIPINRDVRGNLSALRADEIATIRATWNGVAGSAFLSVNDVVRARMFFARAAKITPNSAAILTLQGMADEIDGAVNNPDDVESLLMKRRVTQQRTRLLLGAEQLYRRALSADPTYALAQIRLGRVEFLFKNMKAAGPSLEKGGAAAQEPSHRYVGAMFLGAFLQEQKDLAGARAQFERALEIAPQSQNAVVALAYVELISGRPDRAQALTRGYLGTPDLGEAWWASKNGTLDHTGLTWLRKRVRK